jgi:hypothetical protein
LDKSEWRNLFEAIGLAAIVVSLVFVALQLKQDQELSRAQLGAGSTEMAAAIRTGFVESEFQKTFVKMITQPDQLTLEEVAEINFALRSVKAMFIRECYLVERGVFAECENSLRSNSRQFFQNAFAQEWWKQNDGPNPYLPNWLSEEIAEFDPTENQRQFEQLQQVFQ